MSLPSFTQQIHRISFPGVDISANNLLGMGHIVLGSPPIQDCEYLPIGIGLPVTTLVNQDSQFWIERDSDGIPTLCTTKTSNGAGVVGFFSLYGPKLGTPFISIADEGTTYYKPESNAY